jgi:hypothetical protein
MENRKSRRYENNADKLQELEEKQELNLTSEEVETEELISFDAFFQSLLRQGKVLEHHKVPMRKYVESQGIMNEVSKEKFEQILKTY